MKNAVFTLQGPLEGKTMVILDRYRFVDGQMTVSENDGVLMKAILCNCYGCALEFVDPNGDAVSDLTGEQEGSLAASLTKPGGMTEADKVAQQNLNAKLSAAKASESSEPSAGE